MGLNVPPNTPIPTAPNLHSPYNEALIPPMVDLSLTACKTKRMSHTAEDYQKAHEPGYFMKIFPAFREFFQRALPCLRSLTFNNFYYFYDVHPTRIRRIAFPGKLRNNACLYIPLFFMEILLMNLVKW